MNKKYIILHWALYLKQFYLFIASSFWYTCIAELLNWGVGEYCIFVSLGGFLNLFDALILFIKSAL